MALLQYLLESPMRWTLSGTKQIVETVRRNRTARRMADERKYGLNG